jgi:hypothetical protein
MTPANHFHSPEHLEIRTEEGVGDILTDIFLPILILSSPVGISIDDRCALKSSRLAQACLSATHGCVFQHGFFCCALKPSQFSLSNDKIIL